MRIEMRRMKLGIIGLFLPALLASCKYFHRGGDFDKWSNLKQDDFRDALLGVRGNYDNVGDIGPNGMTISKLLAETPPPPMGNGDLISFSITEEVPLKDVFVELGRLADIDIQIDPQINRGIIFKATEKPVNVIVDKICSQAGLKYEYADGILKIERDLPFSVNYDVAILTQHPIWDTMEGSLNYIFETTPIINQELSGDSESSPEGVPQQKMSINQPAGIVSVYAAKKTQEAIKNYIEQMKRNYEAQVLIEAKVLEVSLNDSHSSGIDWTRVKSNLNNASSSLGITAASGLNSTFSIPVGNYDLNAVVNAVSEFGQAKTLASPRVHTLNNQKATIEFVTPIIYFSVEKDDNGYEADGVTPRYTYSSTKQEDEEGVKLDIIPTIDKKTNEITLTVIPELRNLVNYVEDPVNPTNKVPSIAHRKIETSLKIKSGDVMVIGGLIQDKTVRSRKGVPFLKDIPVFGLLFGSNSFSKEISETIVFIKATIVDEYNPLNDKDRRMLKTFDTGV
ncbi:MAG: hypothetical protein LBB09_00865 [Rickettsiales bacterium]|jgi:general secretion pathway protein D|nr:hypothetical protein [Rickettsiales bacterium]